MLGVSQYSIFGSIASTINDVPLDFFIFYFFIFFKYWSTQNVTNLSYILGSFPAECFPWTYDLNLIKSTIYRSRSYPDPFNQVYLPGFYRFT